MASAEEEIHDERLNSTMQLHILSPSPEIPNQLSLPSVLPSTTVGQLKTLIHDAVATSPSPGRQRLIHRGRMLGSDSETMLEVFGRLAIQENPIHSLHLVLRPDAASSRDSTAPVHSAFSTPPQVHPRPSRHIPGRFSFSTPQTSQPVAPTSPQPPSQTSAAVDQNPVHPAVPGPLSGAPVQVAALEQDQADQADQARHEHRSQRAHINRQALPNLPPSLSNPTVMPPPTGQMTTSPLPTPRNVPSPAMSAQTFQHLVGQAQPRPRHRKAYPSLLPPIRSLLALLR
ncbi:MAG: hypothetical protein M1838_000362 [Thelocarpon superellum]|nr:MAG: hypothetical protein M1838_000362 [Thelocarpon superellum]